jgi:hypothetical protein
MLSIKTCREILGEDATSLTDEEIIQIREFLSSYADIVLEQIETKGINNTL